MLDTTGGTTRIDRDNKPGPPASGRKTHKSPGHHLILYFTVAARTFLQTLSAQALEYLLLTQCLAHSVLLPPPFPLHLNRQLSDQPLELRPSHLLPVSVGLDMFFVVLVVAATDPAVFVPTSGLGIHLGLIILTIYSIYSCASSARRSCYSKRASSRSC
jgi:hypothetical protein